MAKRLSSDDYYADLLRRYSARFGGGGTPFWELRRLGNIPDEAYAILEAAIKSGVEPDVKQAIDEAA